MAAGQHAERPLIGRAVEHVGAGGAGAVVGVRPERDVLVPLHLVAALRPFEIELRLVELDVRADQVGDRIGQRRALARGIFPVQRMMIVHAGEPAQARVRGRVALVEVPGLVRFGDLAAAVDHLVGDGAQLLDPAVGQELLQQDVAVLEIELALLLGQDLRLDRQHLLGRHGLSSRRRRRGVRRAHLIYHRYTSTQGPVKRHTLASAGPSPDGAKRLSGASIGARRSSFPHRNRGSASAVTR